MSGFKYGTTSFIKAAIVSVALILPNVPVTRSQASRHADRSAKSCFGYIYVAPRSVDFQKLYNLLRDRRALEKMREVLSPVSIA